MFARDQRDPPPARAVRVPNGAAHRRRVQVVAQRPAIRHGHDEARERHRRGLPLAPAARRADAHRPRRVRRRAREDGTEEEEEARDRKAAHLGLAQVPVRRAREDLRARVVHLALAALRRARRGLDRACRVHALEGGCRILRSSGGYVRPSSGMRNPLPFR